MLATAAAAALSFGAAACGEEEGENDLTADEVVRRAHTLDAVEARGTGVPVTVGAFVLAGQRRSIFVLAGHRAARRVKPGQELTVLGTVKRLTREQARGLADDMAKADPAERLDRRFARLLRRARRRAGSPYIEFREFRRRAGGDDGRVVRPARWRGLTPIRCCGG